LGTTTSGPSQFWRNPGWIRNCFATNPEWIGYVPQERRRSLGDWALALAFALGSLVFAAGLLAGWLIWG